MTAFDNIKVNNWPATSNDFEDFLVLKMPLNDNASLTESLPVSAGSKVLYPKRTLTNSGVYLEQSRSVVNVKLHTFIHGTPATFKVNGNTVPRGTAPNGDVTYTVAVNGGLSSIAWSYDSSNGPYCYMRGIEVDLGDGNGYQLIQDGSFGVAAYSSLISGTADSNYPLSNLFGGTIGTGYANGTRHTNPGTLTLNLSSVFPAKKHYDSNAIFNGTSSRLVTPGDFAFGTSDFTVECWAYPEAAATSEDGLFQISTNSNGYYAGNANTVTLQSNSGAWRIYANDTSNPMSTSVVNGQWVHLALVRNNGTLRLYVNGVQDSTTISDSKNYTCTHIAIGTYYDLSYVWDGKIQDFRVYKGVAKYTPTSHHGCNPGLITPIKLL